MFMERTVDQTSKTREGEGASIEVGGQENDLDEGGIMTLDEGGHGEVYELRRGRTSKLMRNCGRVVDQRGRGIS